MELDQLAVTVTARDHARGQPDAPVTIVEYGDYECPYCGRTHPLVKRLLAERPQLVRFIFRHFPLNSVHPHASSAALAAEAAHAQGRFWEMHDLLFKHQDDLADADLLSYALKTGLEIYRFESDLAGQRGARRIQDDVESGKQSGVTGTPTLFINGRRYSGKLEYDALLAAVNTADPRAPTHGAG
jgi:protein-disulfide isomerase